MKLKKMIKTVPHFKPIIYRLYYLARTKIRLI